MLVAGLDLEGAEQIRPVVAQSIEGFGDSRRRQIPGDDRLDDRLVDALRTRRIELAIRGVLAVSEDEFDFPCLAGGQLEPDVV